MVNGFLLGFISAASLVAGAFFFKFWRRTGDRLFLAFGLAFTIEAFNRASFLFIEHPNEGSPAIYLVRVCAWLLIALAILAKNGRRS